MTLGTPERDRADEAEDTHPPDGVEETLDLVRGNVLRLLESFPKPPSTLRVRAGGVTVEAEWSVAEPFPSGTDAVERVTDSDWSVGSGPHSEAPGQPVPGPDGFPDGRRITSPAVGVLYRSPEPGAPPFVEEGETVEEGQQIAIVEVMKLMLPVHSDVAGRVVAVLVANAANVEFGEPLLIVEPH
ncbi:acetyl-CoA carboxylase biotin carboxyl carrier protein [Nocardiopsis nanhaiensis]